MGHQHLRPEHHEVVRRIVLGVEPPLRPAQEHLGARRSARGVGEDRFLDEAGDGVVQVALDPFPQISTVGVMTGLTSPSGRNTKRTSPRGAGSSVNRPSSSTSTETV